MEPPPPAAAAPPVQLAAPLVTRLHGSFPPAVPSQTKEMQDMSATSETDSPQPSLQSSPSDHALTGPAADLAPRHWFTPASADVIVRSESADVLPSSSATPGRQTLKKGSGHGGGGTHRPGSATARATRPTSPEKRTTAEEGSAPAIAQDVATPAVVTSAKSFRAPVLLPAESSNATAAASSDGAMAVPSLASSTFAAIARSIPAPSTLSLQGLRPEDLTSNQIDSPPQRSHSIGARPGSATQRVETEQPDSGLSIASIGRPQSARPLASREPVQESSASAIPSTDPQAPPTRPMSARPSDATRPFDPAIQLASAFAAVAPSPPRPPSSSRTGKPQPAGIVGLGSYIRRKSDRATSAARRAWSVQAKVIRPPGIPSQVGTMTTEREKQLLFKSYAEDASQVSSQFRPDSASSSGRSSDASGARTPLRPSTARSASNTPRTLASAASLSYRPSSALHGGPGRTARAYAPSALGSPPQSIPATSPLLTSEANIFYGTPAEQIEAIYANEKEITARRFEKTESAKTNAPPFIPDVGLTLHTGREKSERPVASPGKKLVKDIITGESKEVDVTFDSAGMEIRDDDDPSDAEDENERKYADPSADALRPTSPPAVVLVRGEGGFHHFRADSKPIRVVDEDTFRDLELFKTRRLRTEQLEAERKQEEMETNVGARPAWKSYDDYSVRNLLGGKLPAALQPPGYDADLSTSTQLAQERQANVHYPPSFVPAHMLPPSALTGVDTGDAPESVSSLTRHTMQTSTIGDYSAVRPLTALPRGAKKTRARIRAESAHEERRRVLSMNAFSIATMHRIPVPSVSAPADADFSEATPEELKRAADEQRRRIKGTHYATAAWKAKINDNTSSQTGAAVARPNSAVGSEYAQRRLRPFSAYRASEADESLASTPRHGFNSRSVGSASARTPLPSSSQSVQMRAELAAKKAFHLATNRAIARQGFIDIESYNEAARQAHARAVELGLTTSVDPSTFGIQVGAAPASPSGRRPGSAPQRRTKKAYFGPGDVRKVHGEVREKREMEAAEAEAAAAEEYARAMEEAAAQSQAAAAVAESVAASSSDAALVSPATGQFLPIAEEKTDETMDEAAAHVFHHPRSTHSSRLRFLASPRAANYIGTSQHLPLRAFVAPTSSVRIANTHGARDRLAEGATQQETAAAIQSDEAAPGWASVASNTVGMGQLERWDSKQRRLHGSPERPERFVLVTEPGPSDFATLDALRDESTPRVHHASFPLRTRILSASGDVVSDFLYTASRPTPSPSRQGSLLKGRAGAAVVATTAQPTSEVRALAQVPMTARHSFSPPARGNRRRPLAATARPASGSTTRAIDAQERDRAEYLARFQPPTEVVSEQGQPVRTLRVIHFNELPSTRNRVFSRLAHHPDEARVLSNMWTPSSLITAASTF